MPNNSGLLQILNGDRVTSYNEFVDQFSKKNSFRQIYEFIKGHPELFYKEDIPKSVCLCEYERMQCISHKL